MKPTSLTLGSRPFPADGPSSGRGRRQGTEAARDSPLSNYTAGGGRKGWAIETSVRKRVVQGFYTFPARLVQTRHRQITEEARYRIAHRVARRFIHASAILVPLFVQRHDRTARNHLIALSKRVYA